MILSNEVQRRIRQIKIQQNRFCAIVSLGLTVGQQRLTSIRVMVICLGEDIKGSLSKRTVIFEALIPRADGKDSDRMGSRSQIRQNDRLLYIVDRLVRLIVYNDVQMRTQA